MIAHYCILLLVNQKLFSAFVNVLDFIQLPKNLILLLKRIIRYLVGTCSFELWYPKEQMFFLKDFSDAHYTVHKDDQKSTSGACQILRKSLISWNNKKQVSISLSTMEAEYISIGQHCAQILWMVH